MANSVLHSPRNPHFFQPLLPGFHYHLSIPLKFFSEHIEGRNERNTAELRSDASENTWKVEMEGRRLTVGWKEFTIAHDLRIGDIIIFRHEGDLVFHVTCFGPSCSEIQYDVEDNIGNLSAKQNLKTEPESFSSDQTCFVARVTCSNLREDTLFLPRKFVRPDGLKKSSNRISLSLINEGARTWTLILKFRESSRTFYMKSGWTSFCRENGLKPGDSVTFKLGSNSTRTPLLSFSSAESKKVSTKYCSNGKRKETGETSQRVSSSSSSLSESRFVTLTVTPASFKHCRLHRPTSFTRGNGMENAEGKKVTLLDKHGVEWPVNLVMSKRKKRNKRINLGSGLKEFLKAIGVKAYQSFVLELVWEDTISFPMLKFCSKVMTRL